MGIYIKGMEMPKSCGECDYCHPTDKFPCWCYLVDIPIKPSETDLRDGLCPLIEVTEPHGRLIDADKLDAYKLPSEKQDFKTWHKHSAEYKYAVPVFNSALDMVKNNAPTVIEAEGE